VRLAQEAEGRMALEAGLAADAGLQQSWSVDKRRRAPWGPELDLIKIFWKHRSVRFWSAMLIFLE